MLVHSLHWSYIEYWLYKKNIKRLSEQVQRHSGCVKNESVEVKTKNKNKEESVSKMMLKFITKTWCFEQDDQNALCDGQIGEDY